MINQELQGFQVLNHFKLNLKKKKQNEENTQLMLMNSNSCQMLMKLDT